MSSSSSSSQSSVSSSDAMTYSRGVRLRRYAQSRYRVAGVDGFRFRVVAYGAYLMSNSVFRFLRGPGATPGTEADTFDGVCSPADLQEFPEGDPSADDVMKFFRLSEIDLVFRSQSEAEEAWDLIQTEVGILVSTLDAMDLLTEVSDVAAGNPPPADPPTDSSSSSSIS